MDYTGLVRIYTISQRLLSQKVAAIGHNLQKRGLVFVAHFLIHRFQLLVSAVPSRRSFAKSVEKHAFRNHEKVSIWPLLTFVSQLDGNAGAIAQANTRRPSSQPHTLSNPDEASDHNLATILICVRRIGAYQKESIGKYFQQSMMSCFMHESRFWSANDLEGYQLPLEPVTISPG